MSEHNTTFELLPTLSESRSFRSLTQFNGMSITKASDFMYLSLILLYIYSMEDATKPILRTYVRRTRTFNNYDFFRQSETDLYMLAFLLSGNNKSYVNNEKLLTTIHFNASSFTWFIDKLALGNLSHTTASSYFYSLERQIHIRRGQLKNFRREALRWDIIDASEKAALLNNISQHIKLCSYVADVLDPIRKIQD